MSNKIAMLLFVFFVLTFALLFGCSKGDPLNEADLAGEQDDAAEVTASPPENKNTDENVDEKVDVESVPAYTGGAATVLIADHNAGIRGKDDWIEEFFVGPVERNHPEIAVQMSGDSVNTLIKAGMPPDLVLISNPRLHQMVELDLPENLSEMIHKYQVDLSKFDPAVIDEIGRLSGESAMLGLPFSMNYGATIYNRDIFDRFGIDYPGDEMTWDEFYELARPLTRSEEGVHYFGLIMPNISEMFRQSTVPVVNVETMEANIATEAHAAIFALVKKFETIPGYERDGTHEHQLFFKDQIAAMYPGWIAAINTQLNQDGVSDSFSWDLTTYPTLNEKPNVGKQVDFHMAVVNQASPHKEAAYQVVLSIISNEVQAGLSRVGRISPLVDENIRGLFGAEGNMFENTNLSAIFKVQAAPMPDISKYDAEIETMLRNETSVDILKNDIDINTALRQAEEKANKEIIIED